MTRSFEIVVFLSVISLLFADVAPDLPPDPAPYPAPDVVPDIEPGTASVDVGGRKRLGEGMGLIGAFLGLLVILIIIFVLFIKFVEKRLKSTSSDTENTFLLKKKKSTTFV